MPIITCITGVDTIKQQSRAAYSCRSKSAGVGLDCGLRLYASSVCDTQHQGSSSMWHYIIVMP